MTERNYTCKDVELLIASQMVLSNFQTQLPRLCHIRKNWTRQYASELEIRINKTIDRFLGLDNQNELSRATSVLLSMQQPALQALSFLKTQVDLRFSQGPLNPLELLGFTRYWAAAQKGRRNAFVGLLYSFKNGLSSQLRDQLLAKGIAPALLDSITDYATQLELANIKPSTYRTGRATITNELIAKLNWIYREVSEICRIVSGYYKNDRLNSEKFTFQKLVKNTAKKI